MLVPTFIVAQDEIILRDLMIKVSMQLNGEVKFQVTHDGKKFVAWYYDRIENVIASKKVANEVKQPRSRVR